MERDFLTTFFAQTGRVNATQAKTFAEAFSFQEISKNENWLQEGSISNAYLVLEEGIMRSYVFDPEGRDITTAFYLPGMPVFEVNSFFTRVPALENIQAMTDCKVWSISFEALNTLFHEHQEFREMGRFLLVRAFAHWKTRSLQVITQSAEERYRQLLREQPELVQQIPLKHLASYLGITDSSLSRIRGMMK